MSTLMQADVPSRRAGGARQICKKGKAKATRRAWKAALRNGEDAPKEAEAHPGRYQGWIS